MLPKKEKERPVASVAFEAPFTVEVIDRDSAKDSQPREGVVCRGRRLSQLTPRRLGRRRLTRCGDQKINVVHIRNLGSVHA